jgi:hypothetical protein
VDLGCAVDRALYAPGTAFAGRSRTEAFESLEMQASARASAPPCRRSIGARPHHTHTPCLPACPFCPVSQFIGALAESQSKPSYVPGEAFPATFSHPAGPDRAEWHRSAGSTGARTLSESWAAPA